MATTKFVGLNYLAADTQGNIGWQSVGAVPIRKGYSGRLPADGSSGTMGWDGFLPFEELPRALNPPEGYIINCNHRVITDDYSHPISHSWSAPYRYERVRSLLQQMGEPTVEGCRTMQMDVYSLQAEAVLAKVLSYSFEDPRAAEAAELLATWDRQMAADSAGAAVYGVFLTEFVRALLEDELGDDLFYYYHIAFKKYLIQDVILDRPTSTVWDRKDTAATEGPQEILEMALAAAIDFLESELGGNRSRWAWGRLHAIEWRHAGATSGLTRKLLNVGPFPVGGDGTTLNANTLIAAKGEYRPIHIPALRMIAPLDNLEGLQILATIGQSGQPGHPHYDDMVQRWLAGELITLPSSDAGAAATAEAEMILRP
jgi:penicillin amidase